MIDISLKKLRFILIKILEATPATFFKYGPVSEKCAFATLREHNAFLALRETTPRERWVCCNNTGL